MIPLVPRVHHDVEEAGAHGPWGHGEERTMEREKGDVKTGKKS
jgi:hypothetical protein